MENKPKIFKTLVHKETGEWGEVQYEDRCYYCEKCNSPVLYTETVDKLWDFGGPHNLDLDDYELKEVVVIPREEYERLLEDVARAPKKTANVNVGNTITGKTSSGSVECFIKKVL